MLMMLLHVKSIHMKTKEDGKNDDEESWWRESMRFCKISYD